MFAIVFPEQPANTYLSDVDGHSKKLGNLHLLIKL